MDCKCADNLGSNALHYAVKSCAIELVRLLLLNGIDFNLINQEGHSPLSLALKGNCTSMLQDQLSVTIWKQLLDHGADPNIVYPEDSHKDSINGLKIPILPERKRSSKNSK